MDDSIQIMTIEDDVDLRNSIIKLLRKYDYNCTYVEDFKNVENEIERVKPKLILLDINLPYFDGFYFIRSIRRKLKIPIIVISARNTAGDQILGMELGADDYILKPFDTEILIAKIKVILRRTYGELSGGNTQRLCMEGLVLDQESFKAAYNNESVLLTRNEFKILKRLIEADGKVVRRELLFEDIWDDKDFVDENTLTVNVTRVKAKLEQLGLKNVVKTRRGLGYILEF
jgi:DNA-binding response OmpR family regulator